jgi:hypothetical protein
MAEGDIGSVQGSLQLDGVRAQTPSIVHVAGTVYAIAYQGPDDDGWIKTVTISADGATLALTGGSLEFDAGQAKATHMIHVTGNVYAIVYEGPGDDGWIKTVTISADGATIALAGGSLEFDADVCSEPRLIHIGGTVYAIVYEGPLWGGTVVAITISADGATIALAGGSLVYDATQGVLGDIIHIAGDVYAIAYQGPDWDGWIKTVTISADGATIALAGGSLEFDAVNSAYAEIIHISGTIYAIAYRGPDNDGWLRSVNITDDGATITATGNSLEFEADTIEMLKIIHVSGNVYAIAYRGIAGDGWIKTVTITAGGAFGWADETGLEFDNADCGNPDMIYVTGNIYAIAYYSVSVFGQLKTVDIETIAGDGVKHLMMVGVG